MQLNQINTLALLCLLFHHSGFAQRIDRKALVQRHNVQVTAVDSLDALTVGNGAFAFTVDATGLQTFPNAYAKGISLGTQSEWGWHSFPNTENYRFEETLKDYDLQGRKISYSIQLKEPERGKKAADFFRQNPHRLQLGNVGFLMLKKDGSEARVKDLTDIQQTLDLYTGIISSKFKLEGVPVEVTTASHQVDDAIGIMVTSPLLQQGRLKLRITFPYPTGEWVDEGNFYGKADKHQSGIVAQTGNQATLKHTLDKDHYFVKFNWDQAAEIKASVPHIFIISPSGQNTFSCSIGFAERMATEPMPATDILNNSKEEWAAFWQSGAAIDFEGSTNKQAHELERRIILSQYLTKVQCAGNYPPQETGLTYNSWFGKPHLEMHWWHGVHYALWGRTELLQKSLEWYFEVMPMAKGLAERQGYTGARWQKMVDHEGYESPSSVGAFILWQQPHPITFAELVYNNIRTRDVLEKYQDIVFETADFMASFAYFDKEKMRYLLGPGLIPAQERFNAVDTYNPTYELNYWYWALQTAQEWRKRLGMPRNKEWDKVINGLSPLPVQNGVYLAAESAPDSYTNPKYLTDHPSVLGAIGMLPHTPVTDSATMRRTFDLVWKIWHWDDTWGWDFPMTAMTATRLGMPQKAIDALLMPTRTNTYLKNGHNYQDDRLRMYLPGNGGVLIAAAMMVGGYEGCSTEMPGIPKDGTWKVKYEGLKIMP